MKILDRYIIKTFLQPFLFIFSVLFFIFMVNVVWIQMANIVGKGLTTFELFKFFLYASPSVVSMVLPLTILLASIMTFGNFGERYELAAMKAAGISLTRIMAPLFILVSGMAVVLFFFQNSVVPQSQRKAKNMLYNIAVARPTLNFTAGQFIVNQIPGYAVKFDNITGKNNENLEGIFIHKRATSYDNQQTIIAKKGKLVNAENNNYLKLVLFNGFVYEDQLQGKDYEDRLKQESQSMKFDTMTYHFDISDFVNKAIDSEQITDDYTFKNYSEISQEVAKQKKENVEVFKNYAYSLLSSTNPYILIEEGEKPTKKPKAQYDLDKKSKNDKIEILAQAYREVENLKVDLASKKESIVDVLKNRSKMIMHQQKITAYPLTCIIFFMIGVSLGSIVRKGGVGLPVVFSIVIFLIFNTLMLTTENISWKGELDPYIARWLPNLLIFPFAVWLTYKALTDSQLFDIEKYKMFFKPVINKFYKPKEHQRYQ